MDSTAERWFLQGVTESDPGDGRIGLRLLGEGDETLELPVRLVSRDLRRPGTPVWLEVDRRGAVRRLHYREPDCDGGPLDRYRAPASRTAQLMAGWTSAGVALLLLGLGTFVAIALGLDDEPVEPGIAVAVLGFLFGLGLPLAMWSFRLIPGRRRRDHGLMSPVALLVFAGAFASLFLLILVIRSEGWSMALGVVPILGAAIGVAIARWRRDRRLDGSGT